MSEIKRGKFIVLEGGEGAGKSSAIAWLRSELPEGFVFTREPGGNPNAEEIRETIIAHRPNELDTLSHLLLFEAARREHVIKTIRPALMQGMHVICDRFAASTYAYQIVASGHRDLKQFFIETDALVCGSTVPDHTLFLDLEPSVGIQRKETSGDRMNVFDEKEIAFHKKVREGVKEYLINKPHTVIDASQSQQAVRNAVKIEILKCVQ